MSVRFYNVQDIKDEDLHAKAMEFILSEPEIWDAYYPDESLAGVDLVRGQRILPEYRHGVVDVELSPIGKMVTVTIDRPLGTYHPKHPDIYYPINYGFIEGIMAQDGEEQDAYILGVQEAVESFTGQVIAVIHRNDDVEEKWIVCPEGMSFSSEEIMEQVKFQEQYFDSYVIM